MRSSRPTGDSVTTNFPALPGPRDPDEERANNNARAADRARERISVDAIHHISKEMHALVELRGHVALAIAILQRGGNRQAAIDALEGRTP